MLSPWSSLPEDFVLEDYLERYGDYIEAHPLGYAGRWAFACHPLTGESGGDAYCEVRLDLGCGKGAFTVASALDEPRVLFIGVDTDPVCVAVAARRASESGAGNVVFCPGRDGMLEEIFAPGELAGIYLNFPTPHPKGREASARLTHRDRLCSYRTLLEPGGFLRLRTDNEALFSYSLVQLRLAGYHVLSAGPEGAGREGGSSAPMTDYERRAVEMGASVFSFTATPGPGPFPSSSDDCRGDAAPESLYAYLPEKMDDGDYIPPEMARGVAAIMRTREQMRRKGAPRHDA